ncbi:MAG TPA: hypothetical protein VMG10_00355 [Gemmataceae bacterium]|nr:hypothetical protein [Gemmataceae bacterium]
MGRAILLLASGAILVAMVGCSLCHHGRRSGASCPAGDEMPLPVVERTNPEMVLQELAVTVQPPGQLEPTTDYRALAPQVCQCLAAKHAPLADAFDNKWQQSEQKQRHGCCQGRRKSEKQRALQASMLRYSALEIRDQAAGAALEWYYQLAGAEAKTDLLNDSLEHGRKTLEDVKHLKKLGITLPQPIEEYERQVVELKLEQARNQLTIEQLNSKLRLAMRYQATHAWRFLPDPGAPLGAETVADVEAAVQLGLAQRPQLLLLRSMIAHLDRDTLGSANSLLQSINPLLAMSEPGPSCKLLALLGKILHIQPGQEDEVENVRAQLRDYLRERERTVTAEIREAAYEVRARRTAILLAREASSSWEKRIRDLKTKQSEKMPVFAELAGAYQDSFKARGEVVKEFLGWKIAAVKLKQAQGILPAECGYLDGQAACGLASPQCR